MKLSIVIVNYNVKYYLEQCLGALQRSAKDVESEVFVVDNHSRDGSVEYLQEKFPDVIFIGSNHNLGFARANNLAIRQCAGEYVLLLNPDTIVCENTLHDVLAFMDEHPSAGAAGVRMLKTDGSDAMESRRGLPTPMTSFYKMCGLCARYPRNHRFGKYYMSYLPWDQPVRIEVISGAFCMIRRAAIDKVGLLDDDFFMYGEDIDYSFRMLKAGYENWYYPSRILHYKGESTQKSSFRYVHVFYGAMLIFLRKHYGNMSLFLSFPVKMAIYAKASAELIRMKIRQMRKSLGFFSARTKKRIPVYVFIGSSKAISQCRRMARKKGLEATFFVGNTNTMPDGHLGLDLRGDGMINVVYDTDAYSYEDILRIFATRPRSNIGIGTYNVATKTIITSEEVLR